MSALSRDLTRHTHNLLPYPTWASKTYYQGVSKIDSRVLNHVVHIILFTTLKYNIPSYSIIVVHALLSVAIRVLGNNVVFRYQNFRHAPGAYIATKLTSVRCKY